MVDRGEGVVQGPCWTNASTFILGLSLLAHSSPLLADQYLSQKKICLKKKKNLLTITSWLDIC